ncbi:4940_t:CDS:1, partial [Paraglomus brasilianum]
SSVDNSSINFFSLFSDHLRVIFFHIWACCFGTDSHTLDKTKRVLGKDWECEMTLHPRLLYFRESETPGFGQMLIVAKSALEFLYLDVANGFNLMFAYGAL